MRYDVELAALRSAFDEPPDPTRKEWVQRKLAHMVEQDQFMRRAAMTQEFQGRARQAYFERISPRFLEVDRRNTRELEALMEHYSWFTIEEFGEEAAGHAWLLVQHADLDPDFQREVLDRMEPLLKTGQVSRTDYAYLYDRVQRNTGGLQRYGTQGACVGEAEPSKWEPAPLEDPSRVDELRREVGLPPLADYEAVFVDACAIGPTPRQQAQEARARKDYQACIDLYAEARGDPRYAARVLQIDIAYHAACCHALRGDEDQAFEHLDRALELGLASSRQFENDADLESLHADPRWTQALAKAETNRARQESDASRPPG